MKVGQSKKIDYSFKRVRQCVRNAAFFVVECGSVPSDSSL